MVKISNLYYTAGEKRIFDNFSAALPDNCVISAPSGRGKTTLLRLMAGLSRPDSGEISGVPERISFMFQEDRLFPWLTALQNVEAVSGGSGAGLLESLGLGDKLAAKPPELSGGQRRRVALARAIHYGGGLLLLDEPFTGLDPDSVSVACDVIRASHIPYIAVIHSEAESAMLGGDIILI